MKTRTASSRVTRLGPALLGVLAIGLCAPAPPHDHLQCFKIKDPVKLKGVVDLQNTFVLDEGCKVGKAKLFCTRASKIVLEAFDGRDPITPGSSFSTESSSRVCYKLKCPRQDRVDPSVDDQFGFREMRKPKPTMLCTPAIDALNDACESAVPICGPGARVAFGDTLPPASGPDAGFCGTSVTAAGVWYRLIGTGGTITLDTCEGAETDYDTKISVFTGDCDSLACVGGNDDIAGGCNGPASDLSSQFSFASEAGTPYLVLVHGFGAEFGNLEMHVSGAGACD